MNLINCDNYHKIRLGKNNDGGYVIYDGLDYDLIIFDENHFGGTTQKAEAIFKLFSKEFTSLIFLSATYQKTLLTYNIDHDCQFYWNIEDEHFCKDRNLDYLIYKHGKDVKRFLNQSNLEEKLSCYDNMPELHLLSTLMEQEKFKSIALDNTQTQWPGRPENLNLVTPEYLNTIENVRYIRSIENINYLTGYDSEPADTKVEMFILNLNQGHFSRFFPSCGRVFVYKTRAAQRRFFLLFSLFLVMHLQGQTGPVHLRECASTIP